MLGAAMVAGVTTAHAANIEFVAPLSGTQASSVCISSLLASSLHRW